MLISIFSLGLMIASSARDVRRAGMVASILYFPMLLFSGTTIPFPVFPESVQRVASGGTRHNRLSANTIRVISCNQ